MTRFLVATVAAAIACAIAVPATADGLAECVDVRTSNDIGVTVCVPWHE